MVKFNNASVKRINRKMKTKTIINNHEEGFLVKVYKDLRLVKKKKIREGLGKDKKMKKMVVYMMKETKKKCPDMLQKLTCGSIHVEIPPMSQWKQISDERVEESKTDLRESIFSNMELGRSNLQEYLTFGKMRRRAWNRLINVRMADYHEKKFVNVKSRNGMKSVDLVINSLFMNPAMPDLGIEFNNGLKKWSVEGRWDLVGNIYSSEEHNCGGRSSGRKNFKQEEGKEYRIFLEWIEFHYNFTTEVLKYTFEMSKTYCTHSIQDYHCL